MSSSTFMGRCKLAVDVKTHAAATATATAAGAKGNQLFVRGFIISASAAPAAAVAALLQDGAGTIATLEIPAAAFAPIFVDFGDTPYPITPGNSASLTVPDLGASVVCAITLIYFYA